MNYVCFDLGGTAIKMAVLDEVGTILVSTSKPSKNDFDYITSTIFDYVDSCKSSHNVKGICISAPGSVDVYSGIIYGISSLSCIHGPNWKELLSEKCGLPISIENDANCAALGESLNGAAKGVDDYAVIVVGTGIGGAYVKDGHIQCGARLLGGEFGQTIIGESNGRPMMLSGVASTYSIIRRVDKNSDYGILSGIEIFERAEAGDQICMDAIEDFYKNLGYGVYNVACSIDPKLILLGGAISAREDFVDNVIARIEKIYQFIHYVVMKEEHADVSDRMPNIKVCEHLNNANLIGALAHHLQEYNLKNER